MHVAEGILTSTGGMTSHAAVVARGMGTPCVAGAGALHIDAKAKTADRQRQDLRPQRLAQPRRRHRRSLWKGRSPPSRPQLTGAFATDHELGRQVPHTQGPHQRRHPARRRRWPASSAPKASACAAPSTCSSTRERIHHMREMILADDDRGPQGRPGQAPALSAGRFHRHLQGDEGPAGDHPPAGSAAA